LWVVHSNDNEITEQTYNILLKYCEKYEYGQKNINILDIRITKDIRKGKLENILFST